MKRHHAKGYFRNNAHLKLTHTRLSNVAKWKLESNKVARHCFPIVDQDWDALLDPSRQAVTWIGHATFLIQSNGLNILTDPHFSDRASPLQSIGPRRTTPPAIPIERLPDIDVVVISHDHYDHLDLRSVQALWRKQVSKPPLFVVPLKLGAWLSKRGINHWVELDWWQSTGHEGCLFHAVPVQHFSGRGLKQNNTLWAGWIIEFPAQNKSTEAFKIFFAGDTGYSDDFAEIGRVHGPIDLSLIPIGAYEPRWFMKEVHVNPEEAVKIHLDVGSKKSIGMHWGSFILTDEAMDEPPKHLERAARKAGLSPDDFTVAQHGEAIPF